MCVCEEMGKGKVVSYVWGAGGLLRGDVQNGIKYFIGGYRVFIIEVIVGGGFFVDAELFYGVKVWAFLTELKNVHDILHGAKGMQVVV